MGYRYLLDTNIVSDLMRHPQGDVAKRIARVGEDQVCTSTVGACELRYGAAKKGSAALTERQHVEQILSLLPILALEMDADRAYGTLRFQLEQAGTPIDPNDMLIASQALSQKLVLVTDNVREFERVPRLVVKNWLR